MLKYFIFGIGFLFLIEGLVYLFFGKKIKSIFQIIILLDTNKIKLFSTFSIFLGLSLIYSTFRFYEF